MSDPPVAESESLDPVALLFTEAAHYSVLTREQERALAERMVNGDTEARELLVRHNVRLVAAVARRYVGRGVLYADLIQEGFLGLLHGLKKFEPARGYKLSTYVTWWIRQAIQRVVLDKGRIVRVPADKQWKWLGMEAEEIAQEHGLSIGALVPPASLTQVALGTEELTYADILPDPQAVNPEDRIAEIDSAARVNALFAGLSAKERYVIEQYFGLWGGPGRTLESIGKEFGVTREAVRQVKDKALKQIRARIRREKVA